MAKIVEIQEMEIIDTLNSKIISIVEKNRSKTLKSINSAMVETYWNIGKEIYINEQNGEDRASYGKQILSNLSKNLTEKYGTGFSSSNLRRMRQFYSLFSDKEICATLSHKLSWSHIIELIKIEDKVKRDFYISMCSNEGWSVRVFKERINSMLFERTAISKKPEETIKKAIRNAKRKTQGIGENNEIQI